jgi:transcriptional regulator with XRE-family HTH domain
MAKKSDSHPPYKPAVILKELREQIGMTQPRLGELTGFSRDDIANFERAGTGAGSLIEISDALKCYEALATEDKSGDAISAAVSAATWLLDSAKYDVERARERLEAARDYLGKCKADETRLKALKTKSFPRHKADERFLLRPFPKEGQ